MTYIISAESQTSRS